ncbi:hypothetical protein VOLCADRAFT_77960 [Volvox carteri f. nagariensis]|uniref:CRAL-TRIO domain-containing protein n=1 Tax=Volvox carteri f. nagariensis TaxID=3068 RepID=D8UIR9_VOLCA|nr:uncharacterized protein VOLCADRAFT_77960 [Volvox carteri f. nagariensis]EFJ40405.1 hypothetical protein VOLCADRAFT_77960 [Volvox carteri f. nagariensis]|eukprot:XP_002958556.1 hypothetical protein VOLCADRAFT_77960 [Volvox carteri f. nagariensis]
MATLDMSSSPQMQVVSSQGFFGRWLQARRAAAAIRGEQLYATTLSDSATYDFSDLDRLEFLQLSVRDKEGRQLVVVMARNYPAKVLDPERVYRYLITRLDRIVEGPYSVVWFHTGSTYWQNSPGLSWLWRTYERLPMKYKANLHRVYVVHCDLPMWVGLAALGPLLSEALWRKVEWVSRVEFLWDHVPKKQLVIPDFVAEHDALLEDQPLMDYGVVATKEVNSVPGLPGPV